MKRTFRVIICFFIIFFISCSSKDNISSVGLRARIWKEPLDVPKLLLEVNLTAARNFERVCYLEYELSYVNKDEIVVRGSSKVKEDNPYWVEGNTYPVFLEEIPLYNFKSYLSNNIWEMPDMEIFEKEIEYDSLKLAVWLDGEYFYTFYFREFQSAEKQ